MFAETSPERVEVSPPLAETGPTLADLALLTSTTSTTLGRIRPKLVEVVRPTHRATVRPPGGPTARCAHRPTDRPADPPARAGLVHQFPSNEADRLVRIASKPPIPFVAGFEAHLATRAVWGSEIGRIGVVNSGRAARLGGSLTRRFDETSNWLSVGKVDPLGRASGRVFLGAPCHLVLAAARRRHALAAACRSRRHSHRRGHRHRLGECRSKPHSGLDPGWGLSEATSDAPGHAGHISGRLRPLEGRACPEFDQAWPELSYARPVLALNRPTLARSCPARAWNRPTLAHAISTRLRPSLGH